MQTPIEIEYQELAANPAIQEMVADHVAKLETRFGRITACRVVVKGPGNRHQSGGLYDINIRLALPDGREVNIGRTPKADERHSDLPFAVNDAFKRARRQLQDNARRMEGMAKSHEGQPDRNRRAAWILPVNLDFFDQAPARRSIFIETAFLTENFRIGRRLAGHVCR